MHTQKTKAPNNRWWRGGVIYQIYPRSFVDSNGDGIGDLAGITEKLDYVASLGVDGIWLSPFFKSPMKDFGYDVSDYCDVDPMFGSMADFKALVARAHQLGLKVMIDQVLSHCSDQHPWFVESQASRDNPKADWFIWADAQMDGTPPNNWLSIFGGSAWQWSAQRNQYFMHNFLSSQPDLNFHNPQVQAAMLDAVKFWLDLGVDGYRLDTVNFYFHDQQLRNNPGRGKPTGEDPALLDQYPDTTMVGEIGDDDGLARVAEYTQGEDKLHMAYCFDLLGTRYAPDFLHGVIQRFEALAQGGWPCWALSNHDVVRWATRWGGVDANPAFLRLAAAMQMSLRGSTCIYQGDELGLPEAELAFEDLKDPYGITMWPKFKGRDGCRVPMPWRYAAKDLGFSRAPVPHAPAWLPVYEPYRPLAVDVQQLQADSLLNFYRTLLHWRKTQPALVNGDMTLLPCDPQVLAYVRASDSERVLCVFNFSEHTVQWPIPAHLQVEKELTGSGLAGAKLAQDQVTMPAWTGLFARLK
ncbi:MAG: Alpha-glucosidase [Comamonadaceae bacterium]|nr:MAG: Alpha-glucosidase [Comamonadaceae bacterium]